MENLNYFIKNRENYKNLAFFGGGVALNQRIDIFYRCGLKLPSVVCDNNSVNYNSFVEESIPIMSFDDGLEKYDNLYVVITSDKYMNEILQQVLVKIPVERVFYFTPNEILDYNEKYGSDTIDKLIVDRNNYKSLLFYVNEEFINILVKLFYRCSIEMPDAVCDEDDDKYDLHVEGVIPIMSFDKALEQFEMPYIIIVHDNNFADNIRLLSDKLPKERIICFSVNEMQQYIKNRDYSKYDFNMPRHMKKIQDKLRYYQCLYANRKNIKVRTDDFFIKSEDKYVYLVDYMDTDKVEVDIVLHNNIVLKRTIHMLNNEYLAVESHAYFEQEEQYIKKSVTNIARFSNYLSNKCIEFAYIQVTDNTSMIESEAGYNISKVANTNADIILAGLRENNINTLDFRDYIIKNKQLCEDWFFRTDAHWSNRGAFAANTVLCQYIQNILDYDLNFKNEYFDIEKYDSKIYKDVFLGGIGRLVGMLRSGECEEFELLTPKFDTDFEWICEEKSIAKRGRAEKVLILHEQLHGANNSVHHHSANSLMHKGYVVIKNHSAANDKTIFIINDSFSRTLVMFVTQQFKEVHFFDFRQEDFNTKLFNAIEKSQPTMVLMMYCIAHTLSDVGAFNVKPQTDISKK